MAANAVDPVAHPLRSDASGTAVRARSGVAATNAMANHRYGLLRRVLRAVSAVRGHVGDGWAAVADNELALAEPNKLRRA